MMKSCLLPIVLLWGLAACAPMSPPRTIAMPDDAPPDALPADSVADDTIGAVVAKLSESKAAETVPYPNDLADEQISELTMENIKLRRQIGQLKEQIHHLSKSQKMPPSSYKPVLPRKHMMSPPNKPPLTPPPESPPKVLLDRDAPEVPTLSQITPNVATNDVYLMAQQQFHQKNYRQAIQTLRNAEGGGDGSTSARRQMYLLLLSHQRLGNCQSVINIGQRLASRFSGSHEAAEAQFAVGQCQWNIQQRDIAKDTWLKLIASQPDSAAAKRAKLELKKN